MVGVRSSRTFPGPSYMAVRLRTSSAMGIMKTSPPPRAGLLWTGLGPTRQAESASAALSQHPNDKQVATGAHGSGGSEPNERWPT